MDKINITTATKKEVADFEEKAWHGEDMEHYGETVEWVDKEFVYKATDDGKIIGAAKGKFKAGVIHLQTIIVTKSYRKKGVGKMLIDKIVNWGKNLRAHKIMLSTMEKWEASKFYERLGFQKSGMLPKHYLKRDFIIYSKLI
jgi:GNAT superfamily N-acetyltransferase